MVEERRVIFKNKKGKKIVGILHIPKDKNRHPAVIFSHGFKGFKDQKYIIKISRNLSRSGFVVLRFDFTNNTGESEGKFEDIKVSQEIEDLKSAIDFVENLKFVNKHKIGLIGHSLGGFVSTIVASQDNRIRCLVNLSSAFYYSKNNSKDSSIKKVIIDYSRGKKFSTVYSNTLKMDLKIRTTFYKDFVKIDNNLEKNIENIHCPTLFIYGKDDYLILGGKKAYKYFENPKSFQILNTDEHTYKKTTTINKVSSFSLDWFNEYLANRKSKVINCFLRNKKGEILMLKRSDRVGAYKGEWYVMGGYLMKNENPIKACKREIVEETGIKDSKLIKKGKVFKYEDIELDKIWVIYPLLFETKKFRIKLDWEHIDYKWIIPKDISKYNNKISIIQGMKNLSL